MSELLSRLDVEVDHTFTRSEVIEARSRPPLIVAIHDQRNARGQRRHSASGPISCPGCRMVRWRAAHRR